MGRLKASYSSKAPTLTLSHGIPIIQQRRPNKIAREQMPNLVHFSRMGEYQTEVRISGVKDVEVQLSMEGSIEVCSVKSVVGLGKVK